MLILHSSSLLRRSLHALTLGRDDRLVYMYKEYL